MFVACFSTWFNATYGILKQFFFGGAGGTGLASTLGGFAYHLFTNAHNPTPYDTLASFTEATFTGYSSVTSTAGIIGATPAGFPEFANTSLPPWQCSSEPGTATSVYGYFVTNVSGSLLLGSELFALPIAVHNTTIVPIEVNITLPIQICIPYQ